MTRMKKPLWSPSNELAENANLKAYMKWLEENRSLSFSSYHVLWQWSIENIADFWKTIIDYFQVDFDGSYSKVLSDDKMPFCKWFEGIRINYTEHIFKKSNDNHPAIIFKSENDPIESISWQQLRDNVSALQNYLYDCGVTQGDCVVAYMPCIPEATMAFLSVNSIGAIWSSASPDFGTNAIVERFEQIKPKVLFAVDSYSYGGKRFDKTEVVHDLIKNIPSLEKIILISSSDKKIPEANSKIVLWKDIISREKKNLVFTRVPFNDPIWVLYSSGTTGLPKAITHSQGGILLEQLKYGAFHNDFKPGERCFWYTTTGWMMWNYIHGSLLAGGTMVIYDGSPGYPDLNVLWKFIQDAKINHFGTSAGFILANMKADLPPGKNFDLASLRSIGSTGSTLPPEGFEWVYQHVKKDLWLASMSGGTDVCSAFVGGNPTLPVYAGEIQCRALGCKLEAFNDEGVAVINEVGEMVITQPMPSMPIYFWNDKNFSRYQESYFEMFPGIWRHGDWIMITENEGVIIYGRSDATLNRGGIRIGTSEIYRAVDLINEVKDSMIICIEKEKGEFWMPLFVVLKEETQLTDALRKKINDTIRSQYSPRHIPDEIIAVPDIPYTISGKKTETPVKKILMGKDPAKVINSGALKNPASLNFFVRFAAK
jgi:acetoacetyl-CoA synthetase